MDISKKFLLFKLKFLPMFFSSKDMVKYLKNNGIKIGTGCRFYRPSSINIDISRPANLIIGDYCKITSNVTILAHDYSYSVARRVYGTTLEKFSMTKIGNNVFIGMGAIILPGSVIGDNVIIGAGSIVSGNVASNTIIAGNPAREIGSLDNYIERRKKNQKEDAKKQYLLLKEYYGKNPTIKQMENFYPLYIERNREIINDSKVRIKLGGDNPDEVLNDLLASKGEFKNYEEFCCWAESDTKKVGEFHAKNKTK